MGSPARVAPSAVRHRISTSVTLQRVALVLVVVIAFLARVGVVAADSGYKPANDSLDYDRHARSIAAGDGYPQSGILLQGGPTALRPPSYPYLLGAVYALSGDDVLVGRIAGALIGTVGVFLIYLVARTIWGWQTALLSAALAAVFPPLVLVSKELYSEPLYIVLELSAVLGVFALRRSGGLLRWAMVAGVLCGLATLTRNVGLALVVPIALGVWTKRPRWHLSALAAPATVLLFVSLTMAPWTLRNAVEFGRFIPISSGTGFTLAGTYNRQSYKDSASHGGWRNPQALPQFAALFKTLGLDEGDVDAILRQKALGFAWEHPGYVAEVSVWNLMRMFELSGGSVVNLHGNPVDERGIGDEDPPIEQVGIAISIALAAVGIATIVKSRRSISHERSGGRRIASGPWFMWLIPIATILTTLPLGGLPRYRLVVDPFILMLAGVGLAGLVQRPWRVSGAAA